MANIEICVGSIEPFVHGRGFGEAGPYSRVRGVARGELDPAAPQNAVIVDLDRAPGNARGGVEYEIAGIRLPPIVVPLGTHTGWNLYRAQPGELADRDGSFIPFARTRSAREATGDPRPSLEELYGNRENYVAEVEAAAAALVAERLLLPADAEADVETARSHYLDDLA